MQNLPQVTAFQEWDPVISLQWRWDTVLTSFQNFLKSCFNPSFIYQAIESTYCKILYGKICSSSILQDKIFRQEMQEKQEMSNSFTAFLGMNQYKLLGSSSPCLGHSWGRKCFFVSSWQSRVYFGWHCAQVSSKEICTCTHLIGQQNGMHSEISLKFYITYLLSEEKAQTHFA